MTELTEPTYMLPEEERRDAIGERVKVGPCQFPREEWEAEPLRGFGEQLNDLLNSCPETFTKYATFLPSHYAMGSVQMGTLQIYLDDQRDYEHVVTKWVSLHVGLEAGGITGLTLHDVEEHEAVHTARLFGCKATWLQRESHHPIPQHAGDS